MENNFYLMSTLLATGGPNLDGAITPVYTFVSAILPIVLGLVCLYFVFRIIACGIAFSKSDENGTHEKAKKDLTSAIIGFVIPFVLIAVIFLVKDPLITWLEGITDSWQFNG